MNVVVQPATRNNWQEVLQLRKFVLNLSLTDVPLYFQIYNFFKDEILQNHLQYNDFLPSIRGCAKLLQVSKNTVEVAYQILQSEGYIKSIPKKGYQVVYKNQMISDQDLSLSGDRVSENIKFDFRYGNIELGTFPFNQWNKLRNKIITNNQNDFMVEGLPQGEYVLRKELSKLLYESRGVITNPEQMILGASPQQLVSILCQVLDVKKHSIGVENPGYDGARNSFVNCGFQVNAIPLLADGVSIDELKNSRTNVMYVSPSQQFINKMVMSQEKRQELIDWVHNHEYIIEDDYEWEFKYQDSYVPSIQSLSPTKVIYIGRLSKALLPLFNVSYLVLPYDLLSLFHSHVNEYDQPVSRLDQLTLADYLSDGYWYKHVQMMRQNYSEKRNIFLQVIDQYMNGLVEIEGKDTGLHVFLTVKINRTEAELIELGLNKGVKVYGTSRYWFHTKRKYPTVLLGYGTLNHQQIHQGIHLLAEAWFS